MKLISKYFFYKAENDKEIQIIKNNFKIHAEHNNDIFYEISLKQQRKAKILILEGDLILKKIIEKSETKTAEDVLTLKLSYELAQGIDKEIIKRLMSIINNHYCISTL